MPDKKNSVEADPAHDHSPETSHGAPRIHKVRVSNGVFWLEIPEVDLRILCGCPADAVKLLIKRGLILPTEKEGVTFETGPNAILLSDVMVQNGQMANLAEFPVLQMLYRQGMIIPNHPNNSGSKPLLIGLPPILDAQSGYIYRGNYGLISPKELKDAGMPEDIAGEMLRMKRRFAFDSIRATNELVDLMPIEGDAIHLKDGVYVHRIDINKYEFIFRGQGVEVNLNLEPNQEYESAFELGMHDTKREYFSIIHIGEGDGWDVTRPCMSSIITYQGKIYLIDAGPGITDSLTALGISINEVTGIFQTHAHDDHFAGIAALIRTDTRLKYFATPSVRSSVQKKLSVLMSIEESSFYDFFDVHELDSGTWNNIEGLEVKPEISPHPVENTILFFRTQWGEGYKTYAHLADIIAFDTLKSMINDNPEKSGVYKKRYEETLKIYLDTADIKKIDIGGGMIHGRAEDFKQDRSGKILLAHTEHPLTEAQRAIGSNAYFGMQDVLISATQSVLMQKTLTYLADAFPNVPKYELDMLASYPLSTFNAGSIITRSASASSSVYLLVSGVAEYIEEKTSRVIRLSAGTLVGEHEALSEAASSNVFRAVSYVSILHIPAQHYVNFISRTGLRQNIEDLYRLCALLLQSWYFSEAVSFPVLSKIAAVMRPHTFKKGERVECPQMATFFLLESGSVALRGDGRFLGTLQSGDICGDYYLYMQNASLFEATSMEVTSIYEIPLDLVNQIPIVRWKLLESANRRLQVLTSAITLKWKQDYSVGVPEIDEQHKNLFETAKSLLDLYQTDGANDEFFSGMRKMFEIADSHFSYEENMLKEIGYPDFDAHCESHRELSRTIRSFLKRLKSNQPNLFDEMQLVMKNWLVSHLLREDGKYKLFRESRLESA
jgi:hemerythrin